MLEQGRQLHIAGDLVGAAALYNKVLSQDSLNAEACNLLGVVSLQNGDSQSAIRLIQKAISIESGNAGFFNNLGQAFQTDGDLNQAMESYQKGLEISSDDPDILNNMGIVYHEFGKLNQAKEVYEEALKKEANDPEIFHNFGILLHAMGKLDQAQQAFNAALSLEPRMAESHLSLGSVFFDQGNKEAAIQAYMTAIEHNPLYVESHEALKLLFWDMGQIERMDESYFHACKLMSQSTDAHSNLGKALIFSKRLDEAETALNQALTLDPENAEAHSQLGIVYAKRKQYDDAVVQHNEAIRIDQGNPFYYEELGNTLSQAGDFAQAVEIFIKAHDLHPRRSSILGSLTIAMRETDDARVNEILDIDEYVTSRFLDVPDGFDDIEMFNEALHAELEAMHTDHPEPPGQTMTGGTQIPGSLFTYPTELTAVLKEQISKALSDYIGSLNADPDHPFLRYLNPDFRFTGAWSTILHGTGYDSSHIHNEGWISGVYYIKVPDLPKQRWEEGEGCIQFGAPPPKFVSGRNKTQQLIRPIPGMAVFFPSYYWHGVQPYNMDAIRHSMSFDIL